MKESIIELLSLYNKHKQTQRKYNQFTRMADIIKNAFIISFDSEHIFGAEGSVNLHFAFIADINKMFITHPDVVDMVKKRKMRNIEDIFDLREGLELVEGLPGFVEVLNCKSEEDAFQKSLIVAPNTLLLENNTDFIEIVNYFWDR